MNPIHIQQHPSPLARCQRGLTLVEILVALTISLFLVAGVIQLFVSSKQTYRVHDALSRIQENGRFALEAMARDIRAAGDYGCVSASLATVRSTLKDADEYFWSFERAIEGFESTGPGAWLPDLDASITLPFDEGNVDVITLRGVDGPVTNVLAHADTDADLRVATGSGFAVCDVVVAANCLIDRIAATAFQITTINPGAAEAGPPPVPAGLDLAHATGGTCSPGNETQDLGLEFLPIRGSEVMRVSTKSYYIREGASGRPALWRRVGPANPQELVEGVERMEIRYGVCDDGQVTPPYVNADIVDIAGDWDNVCSVRINLLLVSLEDNLVTTPQTLVFPADTGDPIDPPIIDRRFRQEFSTTVGIRNRLP